MIFGMTHELVPPLGVSTTDQIEAVIAYGFRRVEDGD